MNDQARHLGQLLVIEERTGHDGKMGRWYQLAPSRLTLQNRALEAGTAIALLEAAHMATLQPELLARTLDERRDAGLGQALAQVDRDLAIPNRGESPQIEREKPRGTAPQTAGRVPRNDGETPHKLRPLLSRTGGDSLADRQIDDSNESGAVARKGRRFRDDEKNWIWEQIESLDGPGELEDPECRGAWPNRVAQHGDILPPLIGDVCQTVRAGAIRKTPLAALYGALRKVGRQLGRVVKLFTI